MRMQVGDELACEHCADEYEPETLENGSTIHRVRPTTHPIQELLPDGRPVLHCSSLYTDQVHESARMRLVGTQER